MRFVNLQKNIFLFRANHRVQNKYFYVEVSWLNFLFKKVIKHFLLLI